MKQYFVYIILWLAMLTLACTGRKNTTVNIDCRDLVGVVEQMTNTMIHDNTNPPLAARFFSYACLAGYEIISQNDTTIRSMHGRLNEYPRISIPDSVKGYSWQLAALLAIMETSSKMQPSGSMMASYRERFIDSCRSRVDEVVLQKSIVCAQIVSKQILAYARSDRYNKISNYPRYETLNTDGSWYPTPPAYMAAVEPYFNTVRPFTLDSPDQFVPLTPIPFSADKESEFFKLVADSYNVTKTQPEEHKVIAGFWDCNPFAVSDNGHLRVGLKKISPGAHWLGVSGIACMLAKKNFSRSLQVYTILSITLMDSFISCWDEKFRSNRIRPETAIRKYIDPAWQPLLQTPPFPEYSSGHSVVSSGAAAVLTYLIGDNFSYTDNVQVKFGLAPRAFQSFQQAADEAAISRFYGGIHFMDAIENGKRQGKLVGEHVIRQFFKN